MTTSGATRLLTAIVAGATERAKFTFDGQLIDTKVPTTDFVHAITRKPVGTLMVGKSQYSFGTACRDRLKQFV